MPYEMPDNLRGANDNMSQWTTQYPQLLKRNFRGLARIWDKQKPPATYSIMPMTNTELYFDWRIYQDPAILAPEVPELAKTPLIDLEMKYESFKCVPHRLGDQISKKAIKHGVGNAVQTAVTALVDAINHTREMKNIQALSGNNEFQPIAIRRLNQFTAGDPSGADKEWDDAESKPLKDLQRAKTLISKTSGMMATDVWLPIDEYEYLLDHPEIIDRVKYVKDTVTNFDIPILKGMRIHQVGSFYKDRKKDGDDEKIYMLLDKAIVTAGMVGITAIGEPTKGSAPIMNRWYDDDIMAVVVQAYEESLPVIEDYGRICLINNTNSQI